MVFVRPSVLLLEVCIVYFMVFVRPSILLLEVSIIYFMVFVRPFVLLLEICIVYSMGFFGLSVLLLEAWIVYFMFFVVPSVVLMEVCIVYFIVLSERLSSYCNFVNFCFGGGFRSICSLTGCLINHFLLFASEHLFSNWSLHRFFLVSGGACILLLEVCLFALFLSVHVFS